MRDEDTLRLAHQDKQTRNLKDSKGGRELDTLMIETMNGVNEVATDKKAYAKLEYLASFGITTEKQLENFKKLGSKAKISQVFIAENHGFIKTPFGTIVEVQSYILALEGALLKLSSSSNKSLFTKIKEKIKKVFRRR